MTISACTPAVDVELAPMADQLYPLFKRIKSADGQLKHTEYLIAEVYSLVKLVVK